MPRLQSKKVTHDSRFIEDLGWVGAFAIIVSYAMVSFHIISVDSVFYHGLNLLGAAGVIGIALYHRTEQTLIIGSIKGVIAVVSLAGIALNGALFN